MQNTGLAFPAAIQKNRQNGRKTVLPVLFVENHRAPLPRGAKRGISGQARYSGMMSRPISVSIALSPAILDPDVVSILPVMVALAPLWKAAFPYSRIKPRPAANRILASGLM